MPKKKGVVEKVVEAVTGSDDENKDEAMVCEPKPQTKKKAKKSASADLKKFAKFKK